MTINVILFVILGSNNQMAFQIIENSECVTQCEGCFFFFFVQHIMQIKRNCCRPNPAGEIIIFKQSMFKDNSVHMKQYTNGTQAI